MSEATKKVRAYLTQPVTAKLAAPKTPHPEGAAEAGSFCPMCGKPSPGGAVHDYHIPGKAKTPAKSAKKGNPVLGLIVLGIIAVVVWQACGGSGGGNVSGEFVRWVPVDAGHGYAIISVTNHGSSPATAKCTVEVTNDFGDAGWDYLDQPVGPSETFNGRVALTVQNDGALTVNHGVVKDC